MLSILRTLLLRKVTSAGKKGWLPYEGLLPPANLLVVTREGSAL